MHRRISAWVLGLCLAPSGLAIADDKGRTLVEEHLDVRTAALLRQKEAAESLLRRQATLAYRTTRKRDLGFLADPDARAEQARSADATLALLARGLDEAAKIEHELALVEQERHGLAARSVSAPGVSGAVNPVDGLTSPPVFQWPVRGPVVAGPGLRKDAMTGVEMRQLGVQLLGRTDGQVMAPATGKVVRVERLPEGGYALMIEHEHNLTSIVSGLRRVNVAEGSSVAAGAEIGRVGRTLDGAPVVRFAVFSGLEPVDPRQRVRRR
ncbi:MAG: M23 family metallopeptidase [Deltaproteobacteria bacterium]|nr:M23 family metallopeptidase [Deltaproteobacteria bacterium]